jgi:cob(I)alamin adenosyltransferase
MSTAGFVILSVILGAVVILVLVAALVQVQSKLSHISANLATLATALTTVEGDHLRGLEDSVKAINAQFDVILGALPGIGRKAAIVAERRPR